MHKRITAAARYSLSFVLIIGILLLLDLGFRRGILSGREEVLGMLLVWAVSLGTLAILLVRRATTMRGVLREDGAPAIDETTHKRMLRSIWMSKTWIAILAISLPVGIVMCIQNRAWLPIVVGGGMNLFLMYAARQNIRRLRKRLSEANFIKT